MLFGLSPIYWKGLGELIPKSYKCGYCSDKVSSNKGYQIGVHADGSGTQQGAIYICPGCKGPTFFAPNNNQYPGPTVGNGISNVPEDVNTLYNEARQCISNACYTASVMLCRKILMNISVSLGADEGLKFIEYVEYLSAKGYIPPNGKQWVDYIRKKGNEANHEITIMNIDDAGRLITLIEMLLRFIFEFPSMISST